MTVEEQCQQCEGTGDDFFWVAKGRPNWAQCGTCHGVGTIVVEKPDDG